MQGIQSSVKIKDYTIASGAISPERTASRMVLDIDTEGSAATDDLVTINTSGFSVGDQILLRGESVSRVTTLLTTGNITLSAGAFSTAGPDTSITLEFQMKGGAAGNLPYWFEVGRSTIGVPSVTNFRASSFPFVATEGEDTITLATSES